jgi:hypothetical protein
MPKQRASALVLDRVSRKAIITRPMNSLRYVLNSIAGLVAGTAVGGLGGWFLGWMLALGYHKRGPSDPGDAPAYAMIGFIMLGACLGAVVGFVVGIIVSVRQTRQKAPVP